MSCSCEGFDCLHTAEIILLRTHHASAMLPMQSYSPVVIHITFNGEHQCRYNALALAPLMWTAAVLCHLTSAARRSCAKAPSERGLLKKPSRSSLLFCHGLSLKALPTFVCVRVYHCVVVAVVCNTSHLPIVHTRHA